MKQRPNSLDPTPGRRLLGRLFGAGSVAALLLSSGHAAAQADLEPATPNILLLVDTSGSMDYKTGSNTFPTCRYTGLTTSGQPSERSRWIDLVEVLTGSVNDYQCQKFDRNSSAFRNEYTLGGSDPYDFLYPNPYHRPVNDTCAAGPGTLDASNPSLFPAGAIKYHLFDNTTASCTFDQTEDGVLDAFKDEARFGLMTFDTDAGPGTDVSGLWSYYLTTAKTGEPAGCTTPQDQEVGVRNPSAPPWEGRAVGFGNPAFGSTDFKTRNDMIQKILLTTRPYGATPIAGMLDDARAFLQSDSSPDPLDSGFKFGPQGDVAVTSAEKCRKQAIILLSDGQPNMDLRPFCEPNGCPYDKAEDIAQNLKSAGIEIYVIGFALPKVIVSGVERTCSSFADSDLDSSNASGICAQNPNDSGIQACCALNRIAAAGGHTPVNGTEDDWRRARFADNRDELRMNLAAAIGSTAAATTRIPIVPVGGPGFINQGSDTTFAQGFRLGFSVKPGTLGQPWTGDITRQRYQCLDPEGDGIKAPALLAAKESEGDFFVKNVNFSGPDARTLFTVLGDAPVKSNVTMRPNLPGTVNEGAGNYSGSLDQYTSATFASDVTPEALKIDDSTCDSPSAGVDLTAAQCRDRKLKWLVGLDNGTPFTRCPLANGPDDCALVGDFLHSVPQAVPGRPNALITDASYDAFRVAQVTAKRPAVLYAASNDGFLHAFKLAPVGTDPSEVMKTKTKETNELWAFVPPAVLPGISTAYPGTHQQLLDGHVIVKDVVGTLDSSLIGYKFLLERTKAQAQVGDGTWRTILVQSYGASRPGYYAIDVTDPVPVSGGGPKFLWQLVTDEDGNQLFGKGGGTPLITTVFIGGNEVAVAVLPGGYAPASTSGPCTRQTTDFSSFASAFMPRTEVPCYTADPSQALARSLTIVRLDSGEILRTFRQKGTEVPNLAAKGVVTESPLDAPLTGRPIPFPSEVGSVADRVFIGDQDGSMWRLTFASDAGSPADWKMDLFFDGYPAGGTFGHDWDDGQPIITPPIISVENQGNLTLAFSTGEQEVVGGAPQLQHYVWSLVEKPNSDRTKYLPDVLWHQDFTDAALGQRVVGTMALFNGYLYFTTMNAPATQVCSNGEGRVYAMHYTRPNPDGQGKGGEIDGATMDFLTGDATSLYAKADVFAAPGARLSGLSIAQQPTCKNPGTPEDDQYFSYGTHNSLGTPTGGVFELFVPTGTADGSTGGPGTQLSAGAAKAQAIPLTAPPVLTRVDSWAAIVE